MNDWVLSEIKESGLYTPSLAYDRDAAEELADTICEEMLRRLPKEKENICGRDWEDGYNKCLADVKEALK